MSTDYDERTTALIGRVEGTELLPHAIRLLSDGEPVAVERLAKAAGWSVEDVEASLTVQTSAERDGQGRLVGLALALRPTTHRVTVDGRTLFGWCPTASAPRGRLAHVRSDTCAHGHFFSSIGAAAAWNDAHPDGHVYPVEEAFRLDRQVIEQLGWEAR